MKYLFAIMLAGTVLFGQTTPEPDCSATKTCKLTTVNSTPPIDVPPISETYWMEVFNICAEICPAPRISLTEVKDGGAWKQYSRSTCADKTRFLMTAEDGSKHCIKLAGTVGR